MTRNSADPGEVIPDRPDRQDPIDGRALQPAGEHDRIGALFRAVLVEYLATSAGIALIDAAIDRHDLAAAGGA